MMDARGFTLLELLVVLALAVLLLGLAQPMLSAAFPGTELKAAAQELAAGLRMARSLARTHGEPTSLELDLENHRFRIGNDGRFHPLPSRLHLSLITAASELTGTNRGSIRFFPDGSASGGRILLATGSRKLGVDVDWLTGKVRMLQPEATP